MGKFIDPNLAAGPKVIKRKLATKSTSSTPPTAPRSKKPRKDKLARVEDATVVDEQYQERIKAADAEFQDLEFEVVLSGSGNKYLKLVRPVGDLFADDDLKAR